MVCYLKKPGYDLHEALFVMAVVLPKTNTHYFDFLLLLKKNDENSEISKSNIKPSRI